MKKYSGKFNVRVPVRLHEDLVKTAQEQGVSLNSLVNYLLTEGMAKIENPRNRQD